MNKFAASILVIILNPILFAISAFVFYYFYLKSLPGITSDNSVILAHASIIAGENSSGAILATLVMPIVFVVKRKWKLPIIDLVKWYSIPFWVVSILWIVLLSNKI